MKIAHGVEMLEIKGDVMANPSVVHLTLIYDKDNVILVDTGFPGQLPGIRKAVEEAGIDFEKINKIILTHHDIDHIGNLANILKDSKEKIEVFAHEEEIEYINGEKTPLKLLNQERQAKVSEEAKVMFEKFKAGFEGCVANVDTSLKDSQRLPFCGGITVIHTPGHTLGHICLYLEASKTIIAGDALGVEKGKLSLLPSFLNFDSDLNKKSLKKLTDYDMKTAICYHGGLVRNNINENIKNLAEK
ncbi:MBL fold metallo-hydrolase [Clostridium felsineum]|uniref:Metallo-hydrolase YflN n=1 Tax=Clostridium felsineum TaxID=36839 RepID=A0A1S8LPY5_9CLOT|nr:MBL fold metallo-hydrolase [Clostridium felsineum]URZ06201.1 putative metallo-hydrolase YflN [Clostridium felsineum]URZ11236.1 putative metallo-hydrolase YflN [Clostridium felsineum]